MRGRIANFNNVLTSTRSHLFCDRHRHISCNLAGPNQDRKVVWKDLAFILPLSLWSNKKGHSLQQPRFRSNHCVGILPPKKHFKKLESTISRAHYNLQSSSDALWFRPVDFLCRCCYNQAFVWDITYVCVLGLHEFVVEEVLQQCARCLNGHEGSFFFKRKVFASWQSGVHSHGCSISGFKQHPSRLSSARMVWFCRWIGRPRLCLRIDSGPLHSYKPAWL